MIWKSPSWCDQEPALARWFREGTAPLAHGSHDAGCVQTRTRPPGGAGVARRDRGVTGARAMLRGLRWQGADGVAGLKSMGPTRRRCDEKRVTSGGTQRLPPRNARCWTAGGAGGWWRAPRVKRQGVSTQTVGAGKRILRRLLPGAGAAKSRRWWQVLAAAVPAWPPAATSARRWKQFLGAAGGPVRGGTDQPVRPRQGRGRTRAFTKALR